MPVRFAGRGQVHLRAHDNRQRKVKQILWGDWLNVVAEDGDWCEVTWGKIDGRPARYWVRKADTQAERPLEVVFVDVGQGDGCLVVTPDLPPKEKVLVIDAGLDSNMYNFVRWRFGKLKSNFAFHAAIVTHPDQDHYRGFQRLFDEPKLSFDHVYHNGIAERANGAVLGPSDAADAYLTGIMETHAEIAALYADPAMRGRKLYPKLIHTALTSGRVGAVEMLSTRRRVEDGRAWMPGFAPSESPELTIEVLAPVVEPDAQGQARLRWFGSTVGANDNDVGKTKNGHSVLLRLKHRAFTLLFGGDLNRPSEDFLLRHYGGIGDGSPLSTAVAEARKRFRSDVMKSCHHGSADVSDEFIQAVDPFAFVVSSGDEESHVHPRPDLLGRLGRHGRSEAPLILCTEILRSTREREDSSLLRDIRQLDTRIEAGGLPTDELAALRRERTQLQDRLARRNVEVYGAITLRTDGRHLVVAFRMEEERKGSSPKRWQTYWYRHNETEGFVPLSDD